MELHYKATVWCKLKFPDYINPEIIVEKLEKGYLPLEVACDNDINSDVTWQISEDTEEFLSPSENDGLATIELYKDLNEAPIWDNSFESELKRKKG